MTKTMLLSSGLLTCTGQQMLCPRKHRSDHAMYVWIYLRERKQHRQLSEI